MQSLLRSDGTADDRPPPAPDNPRRVNGRRIVLGSAVMTAGHACRVALQFLLLPVLALRLGPTAYGLVALIMPLVFFAMVLGNGGLGAGLVRKTVRLQAAESTVFWFSLALGCTLAASLVLLSGPIGALLGEPGIAGLLRGISPIVILSSLCTVPQARLTRNGQLLTFATSDLVSSLGGMGVAFFGAFNGWGAWSLVAQQLVLWIIKFIIVFRASRLRLRFIMAYAELRSLLGFGINLVGGGLVDFFTRNADIYLINMSAGVRDLGFYAIAMQIVRLPDAVLIGPIFTALFPVIAATSHDPVRMRRLYLAGLRVVALVALPTLVGLGVIAPVLVAALLGPAWTLTGMLLPILVPIGLARCVAPVNSALFLGVGRSDVTLRIQLATSAAAVSGIAIGVSFGIVGVAAGYAAMSVATIPLGFFVVTRLIGLPPGRIIGVLGPPMIATAVMAAAVEAVIHIVDAGVSSAALVILGVGAGVVAYGAALAVIGGNRLYADFQTLRSAGTRS
jgi:O-antigen/teichoic acid export membrane protein